MFALKDKVAVITGAASGIGKATALAFSMAGAKIILADIQDCREVAEATRGMFIKTDVSLENQVQSLMESAKLRFGKIDIVVNNAGIGGIMGDIVDCTEENFNIVQMINAKGVLWGIKHGARQMTEGGSIINTSSYAGLYAFPTYGSYTASKFAVVGLTKTAALELASRNIRVNCVCPGTIDTPINAAASDLEMQCTNFITPLGRIGRPEEVAALIHFLASDESSYITGTAIPIDGGMSAGIGLGILVGLSKSIENHASS